MFPSDRTMSGFARANVLTYLLEQGFDEDLAEHMADEIMRCVRAPEQQNGGHDA
jgi:hypothetical protein